MKKRALSGRIFELPKSASAALVICGAFFAVGCILGSVFAGTVKSEDGAVRIASEIAAGECGEISDFAGVFTGSIKYHAAAFVLGFSVLGLAAVPLLAAVRGFAMSFTSALIIRAVGASGILPVFLAVGIPGLMTVPCFFAVAVHALCTSWGLLSASVPGLDTDGRVFSPGYFASFVLSAAFVAVSSAISRYIIFDIVF